MITLEQIRGARAMLNLKQNELAAKAGISTGTLNNIERGVQSDPKLSTIRAIQKACEAAGIEFTEPESGGFGIQYNPHRDINEQVTILIIDDSAADRKLYKAWLSQQNNRKYKIVEAGDAKEGYKAFIKHAPDCIILDFNMYGTNGFQLLVEMREDFTQLPPIIFVTAMHSDIIERSAQLHRIHKYLNKNSLTKENLYGAINSALAPLLKKAK